MRRSRRSTTTSAVLAAALAIPLTLGDCVVESAVIEVIPPDAARVLTTLKCGALVCFERWVDIAGTRRGVSRVCQRPYGSDLMPANPPEATR